MSKHETKTVTVMLSIKREKSDGTEQAYLARHTGLFSKVAGSWFLEEWSTSPLPFEMTDEEKREAFDALYREVDKQ